MEMIEHPDISAMMRYGRVERYDDMNDVGFLHGYIFMIERSVVCKFHFT